MTLTQRESLILSSLEKHLTDQVRHMNLKELPPQVDQATGEVIKEGSKALKVNSKFGEYFNESFQTSLKKAGKYVTVTQGDITYNVIAYKSPKTISADESKFGKEGILSAQVILVQENYIGELNIPVEENVRVEM